MSSGDDADFISSSYEVSISDVASRAIDTEEARELIQREEVELDDWGYAPETYHENLWTRTLDEQELAELIEILDGTHEIEDSLLEFRKGDTAYIRIKYGETTEPQAHTELPAYARDEVGLDKYENASPSTIDILDQPGELWAGLYSEDTSAWME